MYGLSNVESMISMSLVAPEAWVSCDLSHSSLSLQHHSVQEGGRPSKTGIFSSCGQRASQGSTVQQGLTDVLMGWVTGPQHRHWERLPNDLGPFRPGGLVENEAGGVHLSLQKEFGEAQCGNPPVERGPGTSFSSSRVAFSGTPKDPLF